jgi:hypothetical protein
MMKARHTIAVMAALLVAGFGQTGWAQGKGGGLNRALGASSKANSARGLSRPNSGLSRAGGNLARSNSLGKAAAGMPRASAPGALEGNAALANQQRILDHRLQQAEHLRGISERNGNERLLSTADRMDASATRNFERRTGLTMQPPTDGAVSPADGSATPGDGTITAPEELATPTLPALETARQKSKPSGFWFKSR